MRTTQAERGRAERRQRAAEILLPAHGRAEMRARRNTEVRVGERYDAVTMQCWQWWAEDRILTLLRHARRMADLYGLAPVHVERLERAALRNDPVGLECALADFLEEINRESRLSWWSRVFGQ